MRRVALVETVSAEPNRHHGAEWFPHVLGWLRASGAVAEWWAFGLAGDRTRSGGKYAVELSEAALRLLADRVARFAPETVLFHSRPAPSVVEAVATFAPAARVVDGTRSPLGPHATVAELARALGEEAAPDEGSALVLDAIAPCFERRVVDGAAACAAQPARLATEITCCYRRPAREWAEYRDLPAAALHRGCAFCGRNAPQAARVAPRATPREIVLRQVEAHQRDRAVEGAPFAYVLDDGRIAANLAGLLEAVIARGLRPSTFLAMPRIDEVLAQGGRLRAVLPAARDHGHRVSLLSTGVENFSPDENARLAKGISPEQAWECWELLNALASEFPGTFSFESSFFAGILFTPWTRPSDLRANLAAARRLGPDWLQRAMGTRLALLPGTPIAALAERDGLATGAFGSAGSVEALCLSHPDAPELPWRFADPRVDRIHSLLVRLDPIPYPAHVAEDPLTAEIRGLRARLPPGLGASYVELVAAVVDAVEALGATATPAEVFGRIAASAAAAAPSVSVPAMGRIGNAETRDMAAAPTGVAPAPPPDGAAGAADEGLRITFADARTGASRYVFRVAPAAPGRPAYRVVRGTRVTYDRCDRDAGFQACAAVVLAAAREIGGPAAPADAASWERLLRALVARSSVSSALEVTCAAAPAG